MPHFDAIADRYDQFRALPEGVPEAVREAVRGAVDAPAVRLLEVGAGTGRFGAAFADAGDDYVGVDLSRPMLARFAANLAARGGTPPTLIQADGLALPFGDASFGAVLLVSVLSGLPGWRRLLDEARRVLRPGGALVLGKTVRPPDGIDARMKARLVAILDAMGVDARPPGASRDQALDWLARAAKRRVCVSAAQWVSSRSPRDFLARHPTGARFAALPQTTRDEALGRLAAWAGDAFGSPETRVDEIHRIDLKVLFF